MLNSIPISIAVGIVLGCLAGLGVGGGSLLILWLTTVLSTEPQTARAINLMFFIPSALTVSLFRWHQGKLQIKTIMPAILAGCGAAILGSWVGSWLDLNVIKKCFGGLLIITGLRELFYRPRKAK